MSYYKGLKLELVIADLFRHNGYTVIHNLKKKGKSSVEHQIDVYAEYKAPLHTSSIIIEAKNYEQPIDKDKIMKFVQIVDDLNVDRGIFVTTSDFVASAETTAAQYNNIELWNRSKIAKLVGEMQLSGNALPEETSEVKSEIRIVQPKISLEQIRQTVTEQISKKAKGGLFGSGKVLEEIKSITLVLYPYYDLSIQATVQHEEKTGFRKKESVEKIIPSKISVDAISGGIIDVTDNRISYRYALPQITEDESKFLRICRNGFEMKYVLGMNIGETKVKRLVNGLLSKGILRASATKPIFYSMRKYYPDDPSELGSIREIYQVMPYSRSNDKIIEPTIEPANIITMIENYLDAKVDDIDLVYYPFYEVWFSRPDGSNRIEVMDAMSGNLNENLVHVIK